MLIDYFQMKYKNGETAYRQVPIPGGKVIDLERNVTIDVNKVNQQDQVT